MIADKTEYSGAKEPVFNISDLTLAAGEIMAITGANGAGKASLLSCIQKIRKYADLTELTPYAVHELIKAIYVGAPDKSSGKRRQSIHICYDMIGFIP